MTASILKQHPNIKRDADLVWQCKTCEISVYSPFSSDKAPVKQQLVCVIESVLTRSRLFLQHVTVMPTLIQTLQALNTTQSQTDLNVFTYHHLTVDFSMEKGLNTTKDCTVVFYCYIN